MRVYNRKVFIPVETTVAAVNFRRLYPALVARRRAWFTPRATHFDAAFRERSTRNLIVILALITGGHIVYYALNNDVGRFIQPLGMFAWLSLAAVAIQRQRMLVAGWSLVAVCYWLGMLATLQAGYWAFGAYLGFLLMVIVATFVLPTRPARRISYLAIWTYLLSVIIQYNSGMHPPAVVMLIDRRPIFAVIAMSFFISGAWGSIHYLMAETQRRRNQLHALIDTLEERVQLRTRDLEAAVAIATEVSTATDLETVMKKMVSSTKQAYPGLAIVLVLRYDAAERALHFASGLAQFEDEIMELDVHTVPPEISYIPLTELDEGLVESIDTRRLTVVNNMQEVQHAALTHVPRQESLLFAPLVANDKVLGALQVFSRQPNYFGPDEVRMFTLLAQNLAASMQSVILYAQQVEANVQLRSLDELKNRFLANVSHELKTPLSLTMNFTDFVREGLLGPINERQRDALDKAQYNGHLLQNQIQDLLDMSRLVSGEMKVYMNDSVDLREELREIDSAVHALLKEKPVEFISDIDPDISLVRGDRRRIHQILLNLLSNAAKFTHTGSITLSVKPQPDSVLIAVSDTGEGIDDETLQRIWEPFQQAEAGLRVGGHGLGLAITHGLVEAHGGTLSVESTLGEGATFYVRLPTAQKTRKPATV